MANNSYQVLEKSFINNRLYDVGEVVVLDASIEVADNLKLLTSKQAQALTTDTDTE
jgi:hypothetical protein